MNVLKIYAIYNEFCKDSFALIYLGEIDDELTPILMSINEVGKSEMKSSRKKISYLIAECFQNIIRHSDKNTHENNSSNVPEMFMLRDRNTIHHLVTTNIIKNEIIPELKQKLNSLRDLSAEEIKQLYQQVFRNNTKSEKGGAGLGLIDMARKSGVAPSFGFKKIDDAFSNFFLQVNVLPKGVEIITGEEETSLDSALSFYEMMTNEKIVIVQKGDFSQDSVLPLIQLFEGNLNLKDEQIGLARRILYLLIEMLQNITRHAEKIEGITEGIFYIAEKGTNQYEISTGNFLTEQNAQRLKSKLDSLIDLNKIELSKKYKETLMNTDDSEGKGAAIGLIEMCRHSSERINYDICKTQNGLAFFSLQVIV